MGSTPIKSTETAVVTVAEADLQCGYLTKFLQENTDPTKVYGVQWGDPNKPGTDLNKVLNDWLHSCNKPCNVIMEIGCGGGRWTTHLLRNASEVYAVDGVESAYTLIHQAVRLTFESLSSKLHFLVSRDGTLPADLTVDYVFSFDTFVHFHKELFDNYVRNISRVLRKDGIFHLHFANHHPRSHGFNPVCFQYRELDDVLALCKSVGLSHTGKTMELGGYGSLLIELKKKSSGAI